MPKGIAKKGSYIPTEYKGVGSYELINNGKSFGRVYQAQLMIKNGNRWHSKNFTSAKEAALAYDKKRIELGLEPVNILKRQLA